MKSYFISLDVCFPTEHQTNFPQSTVPVRRILAHICQIKWNLISFDDENDKKTLDKRSYTGKESEHLLVNDSYLVHPVW